MALKRHRRMRANPVELLVVNPGRPRVEHRHNPEWARSLGRGLYRGTRYAAESARDLYHGAREAHRAHRAAVGAAPTMNPGRKPEKKRKNPVAKPKRDRSGRFVSKARAKRKTKKSSKKRARRGLRMRNVVVVQARTNPPSKRRRAKLKANPVRRRRHTAENPPKRRRAKRNPLSKKFQKRAKRTVAVLKKRSKKAPQRSVRRRALSAQIRRASAIASIAASRAPAKKIRPAIRGLQKAMLTRNPSMAGLLSAAQQLVVPSIVSAVSLGGSAYLGAHIANSFLRDEAGVVKKDYLDKDGKLTAMGKYAPALVTAGVSIVGLVAANMIAPKYKGAVFIGGMAGAMLQALLASDTPTQLLDKNAPMLDKVRRSLALGEYTTVGGGIFHGVGEYTTVGAGIFHGVGEYTTVGGGADNATEFAADSLRGLDDASHFAPGEGGVLSGGIFK